MAESLQDRVQLGTQKAKEFFGEEHAKELRSPGDPDLFKQTAQEYIMETCFTGYDRPHLTFRERSLMNLAMLIALNRGHELKIHLQAAFHNGITEEQVCEACRHVMIYCGVPAGRDALLSASEVAARLKAAGNLPK